MVEATKTGTRPVRVQIKDKGESHTWDATSPDFARALRDMVQLADEGKRTGRIELDNSDPENPTARFYFED